MPTTALASFFHVLHPQLPSAVRPIARWNPFNADSVFAPNTPSSVRVEYPSAFRPSCKINTYVSFEPRRPVG